MIGVCLSYVATKEVVNVGGAFHGNTPRRFLSKDQRLFVMGRAQTFA